MMIDLVGNRHISMHFRPLECLDKKDLVYLQINIVGIKSRKKDEAEFDWVAPHH